LGARHGRAGTARGKDPVMSQRFDVCNGDADGLCAAVQWKLHDPRPGALVTGLKRDIELLDALRAGAGDEINVFDIAMCRNARGLARLLEQGALVRYFDHHEPGAIPVHPGLDAHIDMSHTVCTSLLVDRHLDGEQRLWAIVGAYGDNLIDAADTLARDCGLSDEDRAALQRLGESINYNAYGEDERDVHMLPALLYETLVRYRDPRRLIEREPVAAELDALRMCDLTAAHACRVRWQGEAGSVHVLPSAAWARRVAGCFANELALKEPQRAHAVLVTRRDGGYFVSVRAPLAEPDGAHALCARFGGGGRALAAGIDVLPEPELARFIDEFAAHRWCAAQTWKEDADVRSRAAGRT
jgi:hypothetical protein